MESTAKQGERTAGVSEPAAEALWQLKHRSFVGHTQKTGRHLPSPKPAHPSSRNSAPGTLHYVLPGGDFPGIKPVDTVGEADNKGEGSVGFNASAAPSRLEGQDVRQ